MKVYGYWYGGSSYGAPNASNLEVFESIEAAKRALWDRDHYGYAFLQTFNYANGHTERVYCPVVEGSRIELYCYDPREAHDPYPDREITIGPRGGVSVSRL